MTPVALVTDSAAYLPQRLVERYGIRVVSLTVQINGEEFLETEIEAAAFYARLAQAKSVSTSQPSPGRLLEAYREAAQCGADGILSVHIGSSVSGTVASARLAAGYSPVPVTVVDTGQASFAEGLCVLEAAEARERGAPIEEAAAAAQATGSAVGNTFVVKGLELARRGGRLVGEADSGMQDVPVMELGPRGMRVVGSASTIEQAVDLMTGGLKAAVQAAGGRRLRVGVGHAAAPEIAGALRLRLESLDGIAEIIDYQVGPAVGAHLGAGTAGAVFVARPVS